MAHLPEDSTYRETVAPSLTAELFCPGKHAAKREDRNNQQQAVTVYVSLDRDARESIHVSLNAEKPEAA